MQSIIFNSICIFVLFLPATACLYYCLLALCAFKFNKEEEKQNNNPIHSFAIIIPAHNEETVISETLESCLKLDYPEAKFDIYVIADNCKDNTAEIAKNYGVKCYKRFNDIKKGKGFALSWAFERTLPMNYDGYLVIDAFSLPKVSSSR